MRPKFFILGLLVIGVSFLLGLFLGHRYRKSPQDEPLKPRVDTLVIRDTFTITEPKYITKKVLDSVLVPVVDTLMLRDTIFVILPREQVTWEDSLARVYASGILPQVDSVTHFTKEQIIIKEIPVIQERKTKWGVGIQAGMGAGKDGLTPYWGIGISYNILSW